MSQPDKFEIREIRVPEEERRDEQLGSKAKFWFTQDEVDWLFKRARENEDWSEKVAEVLADRLGLPHAQVELAINLVDSTSGVISRSLLQREKGDLLVHGNEILFNFNAAYPRQGAYHNSEHTTEAAKAALEKFSVLSWPEICPPLPPGFKGWDLFVGYLLLDAWIGNSDRHHENWAIIQRGTDRLLAPTYDHGSSMGRNETEKRMQIRLHGKDRLVTVEKYALKCRSALYISPNASKPMLTFDAFLDVRRRNPSAGDYWLSRLKEINDDEVRTALDRVPDSRISPLHREFAFELIRFNRQKILNDASGIGNE